ncbi:hypothetical protein [Endozoicomonas numazuensis]|uniref:hypothetical protein n=1 Tax=Endozoicomonas numazuensis TaxID=1137799 RepID=UPI0012692682|nr:hypothetical protein [Endozoicomonas numazuensis]
MELEKGQWRRLQLINSSFMQWLSIPAPEGCEFQLLAKDGIFLKTLPRKDLTAQRPYRAKTLPRKDLTAQS